MQRPHRPHVPFTSLDDMFERIHIPLVEGWEEESKRLLEEDDALEEASENEEVCEEDFFEDFNHNREHHKTAKRGKFISKLLEATGGFEPPNRGFNSTETFL